MILAASRKRLKHFIFFIHDVCDRNFTLTDEGLLLVPLNDFRLAPVSNHFHLRTDLPWFTKKVDSGKSNLRYSIINADMPPITRRRNRLRSKSQRERKEDNAGSNDPPRSRSSSQRKKSRLSKSVRKNRPKGGSKDEKKVKHSDPRARSQKRKAEGDSVNLNNSSFPTCIDVPKSNKKTRKLPGEASLVTPSPNLPRSITKISRLEDLEELKNYSYSSASSFEESVCSESCLPEGVNSIHISTSCSDYDHNSSSSLTESFVKIYGKDFYKSFILAENDVIYQPSDRFRASPSVSSMSPGVRRRSPRLMKQEKLNQLSSPSSISSSSISSSNESKSYEDHFNYLKRKNGIGEKARSILISWIVEVGMEYKLAQITLHTAIGLIDRSLAIATIVDRDYFNEYEETSGLVLDRSTLQLLGW